MSPEDKAKARVPQVYTAYTRAMVQDGRDSPDAWYYGGYYVGLQGDRVYHPGDRVPSKTCLEAWELGHQDGLGERYGDV